MAKLKDGFYKQTAEAIGSDLHVLLAGGGSKALSDFATSTGVVTALGTNGNYVTWTKNGTANNLTVPYATKSGSLVGIYSSALPSSTFDTGAVKYYYNILLNTEGLFPHNNNANSILTVSKHQGNYLSQLGFSSDRRLYFRSANGDDINSLGWNTIAYVSEIPTKVSQLTNDSGYLTSLPSHVHTYIQSKDNYTFTASTLPNSFNWGVSAGFVADNAGYGSYGSVLTVRTYTGGGGTLQLYAPYSKTYGGTRLKARFGDYDKSNGNSWTDLKEIAWTSDIPTSLKSPGTLTLSAGTFSAKTYDGSANVTVNIPTHTSHLTNNSSFMTETDVNNKISGFITRNVNTSTNTNPFIVSRAGGTVEALKIGVDDGTAHFVHEQNETVSDFLFKGKWNDTESGGGKSAGEKTIRFGLSSSDHNIYVGSSTVLHSGNYTSYTVKKDGTGASGTWGINITGNAESATNADKLDGIDSTGFLRQVVVANNTTNDFNTFGNMTLTGRVDPTTGASLVNAPWTGGGPAGGYGVLTYLFNGSGYGTQMAWGYNSNRIYIRNRYWGGSGVGSVWKTTWDALALTSDIPTVTNYYWANVPISATSNSSTSPTFANAKTTGLLTVSTGGSHCGIKVGNNYINAINGELIIQNNTAIRFGDDSWDYDVWAGLRYVSSAKTIHLGIADKSIFSANNALGGGTLNLPGIRHISSELYNIKVGSVAQHTPSTSGWYTVAQVSGYFNYDIYITGGWHHGMPSTVRVNICNIDGTSKITQLAGYVGSLCSQIRLGRVSTDVWDVQVYITSQPGTMGEQRCIFTGFGGLTVYHTSTLASTSYSVTNTLAFNQISGISLTSDNYTSYALKNYGADNSRPNGSTFTLPGGSNVVSTRSGATSGNDIGIFYLSDDNAFICNSSDNAYLFATFDTDQTADFSNASNAAFSVLSNHAGIQVKGAIYTMQPSTNRNAGIIGTYDPNRAAAIWSMGSSYQIAADGTTLGNLYGAAYVYYGSGYTFGAGKSGGHSFVWAQNGTPYVALGNNIWTGGGLTVEGNQSLYGLTSTCNAGNDASYTKAAMQIREYNFGGSQTDTWGNAPRLAWHWSGRVQAQIGLSSDNHLYISEDGNFTNPYEILHAGNYSRILNGIYLPTTQVSKEQASNDDWIKTHALATLRGHVHNTNSLEWQYLFGISSSKTYGSILRTTYGNGFPRLQVMGLYNGSWTGWREAEMEKIATASPTPTSVGWYRCAHITTSNAANAGCVLISLQRNYYSPQNEHYIFAISIGYNGQVNISQLSGCIGGQRISKVRVVWNNSGNCYFDYYMETSNYTNRYRVRILSGDCVSYQSPTLVSEAGGSVTEFSTVNGMKSNYGFTGDLYGNATSASKLTTVSKTAWGQTYWTDGGVPTSISGNMTGVGSITMTGAINYAGSKATYPMIKFIDNTSDGYGNGIAIGGGGTTIIGGGEAGDLFISAGSGGSESLILASDSTITLYTNCQDGTSKAKSVSMDANGYLNTSYIYYGGHEKNASNPSYVAGFNSSDKYIRSYATSSLSVNYANSSGYTTRLYANSASNLTTAPGEYSLSYSRFQSNASNIFPVSNNANGCITAHLHNGNYFAQIGLSSDGRMYYRTMIAQALDAGVAWNKVAWTSEIPSVGNGTITIKQNGSLVGSFTTNQSSDATFDLTGGSTDTNYYPTRSYTSGLQISSYVGSTDCQLYVPNATYFQAGVVTTADQTFAGQKTFASIRLRSGDIGNYGGYLYFGDGSYAYLAELSEDRLTLNATALYLGISGTQKYYIDGSVFRPVASNSTSTSGIALGGSSYRFTYGYFSASVYAYSGFYESSDERLKRILNPVKVNLDDLSKLRKIYYLWNDRPDDGRQLGMIAQDVQRLYPELVNVDKETGYLSLAYDRLSVLALEAIDVLYKEHKKLKERVDELEKLLTNRGIL